MYHVKSFLARLLIRIKMSLRIGDDMRGSIRAIKSGVVVQLLLSRKDDVGMDRSWSVGIEFRGQGAAEYEEQNSDGEDKQRGKYSSPLSLSLPVPPAFSPDDYLDLYPLTKRNTNTNKL